MPKEGGRLQYENLYPIVFKLSANITPEAIFLKLKYSCYREMLIQRSERSKRSLLTNVLQIYRSMSTIHLCSATLP